MRTILAALPRLLVLLLVLGRGTTGATAGEPTAEERKIEALLTHLAAQKDLRFVRNGTE